MTVTEAQNIARTKDLELRYTDYHFFLRAEAARFLADHVDELVARLNTIIMYCVDNTDGDCQPHDSHLYDILKFARGEKIR